MKWSKENIIEEIKSISTKLNTKQLRRIVFAQNSDISISAVRYHFGNWNNAVIAAGLEPITVTESTNILRESNTIDDNKLLVELLKLYYKNGKITHDLINKDGTYTVRPYVKRWGSPQKALEEALKCANEGIIDVDEDDIELQDNDTIDTFEIEEGKLNVEPSAPNQSLIYNQKVSPLKKRKEIFGQPIDFRGLRFAPINEQGVVYLFGMISNEIGFYIESIRTGFPDCEGKRCFDKKNNLWEHVKIEFEFRSSNFLQHGHNPDECDVIVCWQHDWSECPLEVIELQEEIRRLPRSITFK